MLRLSQILQKRKEEATEDQLDVKIVTFNGRLNDIPQIKPNKFPVYMAYFKEQKDRGVYVVHPPIDSTREDYALNWVLYTLPHLQKVDL